MRPVGPAVRRPPSAVRRYDSFQVRIWSAPGDETAPWLRIEVRHHQTDLIESATGVLPSWLLETVTAFLADGRPP